jgi:hypothetical protein
MVYQFYINGQLVNDYKTRPELAYLSLAIWTAEGVTARFEFDDLLIKALTRRSTRPFSRNITSYCCNLT